MVLTECGGRLHGGGGVGGSRGGEGSCSGDRVLRCKAGTTTRDTFIGQYFGLCN